MSDSQQQKSTRAFGWILLFAFIFVGVVVHNNDAAADCLAKPICELRGN